MQPAELAESFVKTIKRDYVAFMPKPDAATAARNLAIAFEHYNEKHPHSALKYRSPREFRRRTRTGASVADGSALWPWRSGRTAG